MQRHRQSAGHHPHLPVAPGKPEAPLAPEHQDKQRRLGQQQQQDPGQRLPDPIEHLLPEVGHGLRAEAELPEGHESPKMEL